MMSDGSLSSRFTSEYFVPKIKEIVTSRKKRNNYIGKGIK